MYNQSVSSLNMHAQLQDLYYTVYVCGRIYKTLHASIFTYLTKTHAKFNQFYFFAPKIKLKIFYADIKTCICVEVMRF